MSRKKCGGHCPIDCINDSTSVRCSVCGDVCHLPCYDIVIPKSKIFIIRNIGFTCDDCMNASPKRKGNASIQLKQSTLTPNAGILLQSAAPPSARSAKGGANASKTTNEQLYSMISSMKNKIEQQSNKLDELGQHIVGTRNDIVNVQKKQDDVFTFVKSRLPDVPASMAHERFRPTPDQNLSNKLRTPNRNATAPIGTPNGNDKQFGGKRRTYSTVVQTRTPVVPFSVAPRTKEKTISLIHNATGQTVQSVKFPSPKQGKKDVQIGRQIEERQRPTRTINPMTKAIFVSPFHPETSIQELSEYIVANTDAKDETKFKCTMLVKKDADLSQLKSVSFKIDATPEVYDILIDPENWPKSKRIREFIQMSPPKRTFNDFLPKDGTTHATSNENLHNKDGTKEDVTDFTKNGSSTSDSNSSKSTSNDVSAMSSSPKNE